MRKREAAGGTCNATSTGLLVRRVSRARTDLGSAAHGEQHDQPADGHSRSRVATSAGSSCARVPDATEARCSSSAASTRFRFRVCSVRDDTALSDRHTVAGTEIVGWGREM